MPILTSEVITDYHLPLHVHYKNLSAKFLLANMDEQMMNRMLIHRLLRLLQCPCRGTRTWKSWNDSEQLRTTPNDSGSCCGCPRHGGEAGKHLVALHTAVPLEFVPLSTLPYQVLPQTKMKALLQLNEWMQDSRLKRVEAQVPLSCSSFNIYIYIQCQAAQCPRVRLPLPRLRL